MRNIFLSLCLSMACFTAQATVHIDHIEPADWYVGMLNPSLQLLVYGEGIRSAEVSTDYAGVTLDSLVRLDSPNYLFVYLNIKGAQPGEMTLTFKDGKATKKVKYTLKKREMDGADREGFTNADVLYLLMPDRFADGDPSNNDIKGMNAYTIDRTQPSLRHGGDLEGIRQHLDYFNNLGVTTLWFTPVLENDSPDQRHSSTYHGYATTDYYKIDPRLGTNDEYRQLVDEAHAKGLKVVMDMIFNHCSLDHPWLSDLPSHDWLNQSESVYRDKTTGRVVTNDTYLRTSHRLTTIVDPYASDIDMHEIVDGWFTPQMPDLNQRNPHLMTYLTQNSKWWIETVGINGIRMDTYPYADADAMARWMAEINAEYPNFNVVGEAWVNEPAYTAALQKDSKLTPKNSNLTTVMDFSLREQINRAKNEDTSRGGQGYNRVFNSLLYDYLYPNPSSVMAFIENHDTDRFLENGNDIAALKQALALLLTINRIPQLYYGTEILMNGTKEVTDGYVRKDFPGGFPDDPIDCFDATNRSAEQNEMFTWLSRLLHWRQGNEVITKGSQKHFIPHNGVYVVARQYKGKTVLTIINGHDGDCQMDTERYAEVLNGATTARDILTDTVITIDKTIPLETRQVLIIEF